MVSTNLQGRCKREQQSTGSFNQRRTNALVVGETFWPSCF
jgi:hypothetical protein